MWRSLVAVGGVWVQRFRLQIDAARAALDSSVAGRYTSKLYYQNCYRHYCGLYEAHLGSLGSKPARVCEVHILRLSITNGTVKAISGAAQAMQ